MIENFDTAEKALATSQNSTGSAIAENEKYKESIVGTLNEFKAAYEELATTVIDSDFLKGLIDLGTSLLELLNDSVDRFGTLATVVGAAGIYGTIAGKGSNMPCLAH